MNPKHIEDLVRYRIEQSEEALIEAETLAQAELWQGVINRSYYAMFYSVLALAVLSEEIMSKHTGAITFFDREFIRTGVFPREYSRMLHLGFERRQAHDYGEFSYAGDEEAKIALADAKAFVQAVKDYLQLQ